jgi:hypothetical protein
MLDMGASMKGSIAALNRVARKNAQRRKGGYVYSLHTCDDIDVVLALAAATGTAKTAQRVECEASQSGPKGNAQGQSHD